MLSFLKMYKKYFDFNGRITRKEFWMNIAIYHFLNLLILFFDRLIIPKYTNIATSFYIIFFLFSLTPIINLTVRRLHDINKNGWWTILYCLPFLNLWLIFLLCKKSIDEGNIYNQADEEQFLGPKKHWFACLMLATIIFSCGFNILHVKNFNLFLLIVFSSVAILLTFVIKTNKKIN